MVKNGVTSSYVTSKRRKQQEQLQNIKEMREEREGKKV